MTFKIKKLIVCLGTHAEYIKMWPILNYLHKEKIYHEFISTGQHDLEKLIQSFDGNQPNIIINQRDGFSGETGGAFKWGLETLPKLVNYFRKQDKKSIVLVHGDTISTSTTAVAAKLAGLRVAHIESGLRSGNIFEPFPEELMRIITDFLSDFKFPPAVYGNTIYETMSALLNKKIGAVDEAYAVATIHRHENIKSKERLTKIIEIINACPYKVYFAIHNNTKKKMEEYGLKLNDNVVPMGSVDYKTFLNKYMKSAWLMISDGGTVSEESAFFGTPCLIMRMETERKELLKLKTQCLSKLDYDTSINFMAKSIYLKDDSSNPYLKRSISHRIITFLQRKLK
jgi:UDP-N-acetylglucosamine 2-epimerase (non-hydrolysing)